ncbi:hypothetical protein Y032_0100g3273 [Ancylostoma ceylanicum]|uniref:Secreted protein n=1 Tax=Ancylostoma ceylanicum TaxID=53326 RepID=A0A016TIB2_9BILA|nr:hypothetical protein Y032_0100g3273 [Ancylostoma ceylanicum]
MAAGLENVGVGVCINTCTCACRCVLLCLCPYARAQQNDIGCLGRPLVNECRPSSALCVDFSAAERDGRVLLLTCFGHPSLARIHLPRPTQIAEETSRLSDRD